MDDGRPRSFHLYIYTYTPTHIKDMYIYVYRTCMCARRYNCQKLCRPSVKEEEGGWVGGKRRTEEKLPRSFPVSHWTAAGVLHQVFQNFIARSIVRVTNNGTQCNSDRISCLTYYIRIVAAFFFVITVHPVAYKFALLFSICQ